MKQISHVSSAARALSKLEIELMRRGGECGEGGGSKAVDGDCGRGRLRGDGPEGGGYEGRISEGPDASRSNSSSESGGEVSCSSPALCLRSCMMLFTRMSTLGRLLGPDGTCSKWRGAGKTATPEEVGIVGEKP